MVPGLSRGFRAVQMLIQGSPISARWDSLRSIPSGMIFDNIEEMLDKIRSMHPREIAILSTDISGSSSTLEVQGERNGVLGTATVAMQLEDGEWRVQKESWNFKKE